MLRRAIIQHIKQQVPDLNGRVYQAFVQTGDKTGIYATVKLADGGRSTRISYAGNDLIEVRIYDRIDSSFLRIDAIVQAVIAALHGNVITDSETGESYEISWVPGINDFVQEDSQQIGRLVRFQAASIFERR